MAVSKCARCLSRIPAILRADNFVPSQRSGLRPGLDPRHSLSFLQRGGGGHSPNRELTLVSTGISLKRSAASLAISCSSSAVPRRGGEASRSSSSSRGMVEEETMEAERRLALLEPEEAEETVEMTERGDMQEVRPERLLSPLSLLLWLWVESLPPRPCSRGRVGPLGWGCHSAPGAPEPRRLSMLVFHHWPPPPGTSRDSTFSLSEGELLAAPRGAIPPFSKLCGRLLGPESWARARALSFVRRNFRASSEVKVMEELVPPRNLSHPGAPRAARVAGEERLAGAGG